MVSFELNGKVWLATADTGSIRTYALRTCRFDESVEARSWNQRKYLKWERAGVWRGGGDGGGGGCGEEGYGVL